MQAEGTARVSAVWARVSRSYDASSAVSLLYWRALLGQCTDKMDRVQDAGSLVPGSCDVLVTTTDRPGSVATEFYDIVSGTWPPAPDADHVSWKAAFQVLRQGKTRRRLPELDSAQGLQAIKVPSLRGVLVTDVLNPGSTSSELYDLLEGTWSAGPTLNQQRSDLSTQMTLPSGQVLVAGGNYGPGGATYDTASEILSP